MITCSRLVSGWARCQNHHAVDTETVRIPPQTDHAHIVLVGHFNPSIYQPAWFAMHKMIGQNEAEAAEVELIHAELTKFKLTQFELQVLSGRFVITSLDAHPEHIKDLVVSCFGQFLPHTPIGSMGINRTVHFDTEDFEVRDRVGSRLAPKDAWGAWGDEILAGPREPEEARGGMTSITMRQSLRPDGLRGNVQAKVGPSMIDGPTGISVDVNDHFDLGSDEKPQDAASAVATLEEHWVASRERSAMIVDQIMALTEECRVGDD